MAVTTPEYATPQPPKRSRVGLIVAIVAGAVVLVAGTIAATVSLTRSAPSNASAATSSAPATMIVNGSLLLTYSTGVLNLDNVNCEGMGPYDDIKRGSQIVVTDQAGTVVATSSLTTGKMIGSGLTRQCQFGFTAYSVPKGRTFYGIQLGRRGSMQYSETDLSNGPQLKLGP